MILALLNSLYKPVFERAQARQETRSWKNTNHGWEKMGTDQNRISMEMLQAHSKAGTGAIPEPVDFPDGISTQLCLNCLAMD